uniref:Uncharacterized protein n=1 Tax=Schistosoma haematobium TaxID=6185 RepID=A0A095CA89_SCHHA
MASAQVYRFQQRISNLQSHHKLASIRHCEAVSNYISQNNELMKSLMAHLKGPDKSVKRTKRITKPRTTHPQLFLVNNGHLTQCIFHLWRGHEHIIFSPFMFTLSGIYFILL